jgi:hypothetical protein
MGKHSVNNVFGNLFKSERAVLYRCPNHERETVKSFLADGTKQKKPVGVACRPAFRFLWSLLATLKISFSRCLEGLDLTATQ